MTDWFTVKIKYLKQSPEDGSITSKSEAYMLNALSFTEAEARLQGILEEYIPEYNLLACAKTNIQDVIIDESQEFFYKIKVSYISADPDSGKEKKINENYMIQADGLKEAYEKMDVRHKVLSLIGKFRLFLNLILWMFSHILKNQSLRKKKLRL